MSKSEDYMGFPCEQEIKNVFYGYVHGVEMNENRDYFEGMVVEKRAPSGFDYAILTQPINDELFYYSMLGVEGLDVYYTHEEKWDYKRAVRDLNVKY